MFNGFRIVVSENATKLKYAVEPLPRPKRRKGYRVVRRYVPGAYRIADGTLVMHPVFYNLLKEKSRGLQP